ncbi:serine/threonine-protein kinase ATG1c-like isoform X2 [Bidens hawaiensis]|uniref:serine/threonine-protein kinase ATG1c-like isoform X2 n=1 Tax=Bidens hawaiensis TaxID=980011 RepID=UPI004049754F
MVRSVGEYVVGKQIGSGSFSTVWHARHKIHGTEVAIKEILTGKLNRKLEDSLMSEIDILRNINHPNIIRLHEMIKEPGKIHLVLEYCKGGDLSMFIQRRQGRISKSTSVHFMQQLAAGLKVLRDNQIIHRDLKPQNLLLSTNDDSSVLKIADFGFARSLQPRNLAETLCGSPLYMAPEIMQLHKYDAKADLWSVGAILFQLVTGRTPFTGNNQIQLLQNIMKSTELQFPSDVKDLSPECIDLCRKLLRQNPVERLTFEEFFTHPFFTQQKPDQLPRYRRPRKTTEGFSYPKSPAFKNKEEHIQEDNLPFSLDYDSNGPYGSPPVIKKSPLRSTYGFSLDTEADKRDSSKDMEISSRYRQNPDNSGFRPGNRRLSEGNLKESLRSVEHRPVTTHSKVDSLEIDDQDYVLVWGPLADASSLASVSKASQITAPKSPSRNTHSTSSAPLPIIGGSASKICSTGSFESQCSAPSGTSHGSIDIIEQPPADNMTRIKSLHDCASAISELVHDKIVAGNQLEAFSIQLVILAIWKQALDICHTQAASAIKVSPNQETATFNTAMKELDNLDIQECLETAKSPQDVCCHIERIFLGEVDNAEQLAKIIEPGDVGMPDAMETIFQAALDFGRRGAVDECMCFTENAAGYYSKAVRLLTFLLVEAPSLILNPPFSITNSDRYRLRTYIDVLNNRQSHSRSQRITLLKSGGGGGHDHLS